VAADKYAAHLMWVGPMRACVRACVNNTKKKGGCKTKNDEKTQNKNVEKVKKDQLKEELATMM
jgi:hypothetical protein